MKQYETLFNARAINRKIDCIVVHCAAINATSDITTEDIARYHIEDRHFRDIGYHYVVDQKGIIHIGRPLEDMGAHAKGFNAHSIGICYLGGLDSNGNPADTRTPLQQLAIKHLIGMLVNEFKIYDVHGHRDLSPDVNGDGKITRVDWLKMCPCYDAHAEWLAYLREMAIVSRNYVHAQQNLGEPVTEALMKLCKSAEEYLMVEGGDSASSSVLGYFDDASLDNASLDDDDDGDDDDDAPYGVLMENEPKEPNPAAPPPSGMALLPCVEVPYYYPEST